MGLAILVPQFLDENRFGSRAVTIGGKNDAEVLRSYATRTSVYVARMKS